MATINADQQLPSSQFSFPHEVDHSLHTNVFLSICKCQPLMCSAVAVFPDKPWECYNIFTQFQKICAHISACLKNSPCSIACSLYINYCKMVEWNQSFWLNWQIYRLIRSMCRILTHPFFLLEILFFIKLKHIGLWNEIFSNLAISFYCAKHF